MIQIEDSADNTATTVALAGQVGKLLLQAQLTIGTAESCTGGLVAGALTDIAGSSGWYERGAVTYSNEAKMAMLGVAPAIFETDGAVSEACVKAMAAGAVDNFGVDVALSVSGIAGPGGATPGKPVGTVWIGWAFRKSALSDGGSSTSAGTPAIVVDAEVFLFSGDRRKVREQAVHQALRGIISRIDPTPEQ